MSIRDLSITSKVLISAGLVVALAGGGFAAYTVLGPDGSGDKDGKTNASAEVPEGYTTEVTVPTIAPDQPKPATERPETAPPKIFAEGACKDAMDGVRTLIDTYPSGLALDEAGSTALNEALPKLSTDCTPELAQAFQAQELGPWLNYAVN